MRTFNARNVEERLDRIDNVIKTMANGEEYDGRRTDVLLWLAVGKLRDDLGLPRQEN